MMTRADGAHSCNLCSGVRPFAALARSLLCLAAVAIIAPQIASAAPCSNPDGVEGEVVYNTTHKVAQFCNGTYWISMAAGNSGGGSDTLAGLSCSANEIPKWNGTAWACAPDGGGSATAAGSVAGAVQFRGTTGNLEADDTNFVWDDTNNRLGIGTVAPAQRLHLFDTAGTVNATIQSTAGAAQLALNGSALGQIMNLGNNALYIDNATSNDIIFRPGSYAEAIRLKASGAVGVGTSSPNASALLDITSTTKGFLPPRMTTAQRDAIATPATGLVIYNTTTNSPDFFNGTVWSSGALASLPGSKGLSISGAVTSAGATTFTVSTVTTNTLLGSNPATSLITIPEAGNYFMTATQGTCTGGANAYGTVVIKVNGATVRAASSLPNSCDSATVSLFKVFSAGDTVSAECGQNNPVSTTCYFDIVKLQSDTAVAGGSASAAGNGGQVQFNDGSDAFAADAALHWDNTNKRLGIGTASPAHPLEAVKAGPNAIGITGSSTNSVGLLISNTVASGRSYSIYSSGGAPSSVGSFGIWDNTASTNRMIIDASGNVGIGTVTPTERLDLGGGNIAMGWERIENNCGNVGANTMCTATCSAGKYATGGACNMGGGAWTNWYQIPGTNSYTCVNNAATKMATSVYCANIR